MAVYVTGDIHGDPTRLSKNSFYEQKNFSNNKDENVVIILGDFGLVWNRDKESKQEKYWLDWLNKKPFTTIFVDGNHENHKRLSTYPIKEWHGGKVHEIRTHVLHLIRGEVFTIDIFHDHPDFMNRKIDLQFIKLVDSMLGNEKPLTLMELAGEIRAVKINIMEEQG